MYFQQGTYDVRFEWGAPGLAALLPVSDVIIIVDVLSFSTCVDIALDRDAQVYPYLGSGEGAADFARSIGAILALKGQPDHGFFLSPSSLMSLPAGASVVLPSLNGSQLSLATGDLPTLTGCLRNASAVAQCAQGLGERISVIAAGERWRDGRLRPALEDLLGAGAVISGLTGVRSPEAQSAAAAYDESRSKLADRIRACGSGQELLERGQGDDVTLASQLDRSANTPMLIAGAYRNPAAPP